MILTERLDKVPSLCGMRWKGTKLYSIFTFKCPVCHEGEFFVSHPYDLARVGDLHSHCNVCGTKFDKEIGFYTGAMYVSYALGVAEFATVWVAVSVLFPGLGMAGQMLAVGIPLLLIAPWFYALSKIIWANMFFHYDASKVSRPGGKVVPDAR